MVRAGYHIPAPTFFVIHGTKGMAGVLVIQHHLAMQQMNGSGGGIISMDLHGGIEDARRMLERCELFALAESLGGVESLINHPAIMTHASVAADKRASLGISDTLVRISTGVEDVDDLIAELEYALEGVQV